MIIVAPFYLFYISSYYLVFSLYRYSIVLSIFASVLLLYLYLCIMYNLDLVSNLAVWLQQINKLYLLTYFMQPFDSVQYSVTDRQPCYDVGME